MSCVWAHHFYTGTARLICVYKSTLFYTLIKIEMVYCSLDKSPQQQTQWRTTRAKFSNTSAGFATTMLLMLALLLALELPLEV